MTEQNMKKLDELLSDEAFVKALAELESPEEVQAKLSENGVELGLDEIRGIAKAIQSQAEGELDEDALEDVAGGSVFSLLGATTKTLVSSIFRPMDTVLTKTATSIVRSRW